MRESGGEAGGEMVIFTAPRTWLAFGFLFLGPSKPEPPEDRGGDHRYRYTDTGSLIERVSYMLWFK